MISPALIRTDSRFLIVDKPAGWLVHPTRPDGTFTLIDWLREQHPGEFLSLVSRLDRETSGLLLVARGKENASILGKKQQRREIEKRYLALVHGQPPEAGIIDQPLDRLGKHRPSRIYIRQAVIPGTYPAITQFKTLGTRNHPNWGPISLVEASPKTGRLHQIRAHFEFLGFPVLHDKIYGKEDDCFISYIDKDLKKEPIFNRHCLHSSKISFFFGSNADSDGNHSFSDEQREVVAEIPMPEDMISIWQEAGMSGGLGSGFDQACEGIGQR